MTISPNRNPYWMADLSAVTFGIHEMHAKKADAKTEGDDAGRPRGPRADDEPDKPDMVIWHYKDSADAADAAGAGERGQELQLPVRLSAGRAEVPPAGAMRRCGVVNVTADSKYAMGTDIRDYELESNLDGQRYRGRLRRRT